MNFIYKIADTPLEFEQIHELNYRTFVEEIPQHEENVSQRLVDKFHDENTYLICKKDNRVVGMIAIRSNRPFSLDGKIGKVERHLPVEVENPVEIRLLAIEKRYRNGRAFLGLAQALIRYCLKSGYDAALISGTMREQKLYGQLGFLPFAYLTGTEEAAFQPMYLTKKTFDEGIAGRISKPHINFLPGPATISEEVKKAMVAEPFSHRSPEFKSLLTSVQQRLTTLTGANYVQLLHGTGTFANDVVAGQLSLLEGKGLILVNGEFGARLTDHAKRFNMTFDTLEVEWGSCFEVDQLRHTLEKGAYSWLWAVHCETSTGVLNELDLLKELCANHGIQLAIDAVSALGTMPLNLTGVAYATGVSGKGLLSYTGLSFVFHDAEVAKSDQLPRYLDLGAYVEAGGIPYTQSSNLVSALDKALEKYEDPESTFMTIAKRAQKVRSAVTEVGLTILAPEANASPAIVTITMNNEVSAMQLGDTLYLNGFNVHYESAYLCERNWLQIACANDVNVKELDAMLQSLCLSLFSKKTSRGYYRF